MYGELDLESPYTDEWFKRPSQDHRITTRIEVAAWYQRRSDALLAHATQVDPASKFWFGLPPYRAALAYPWDDYILADSRVETSVPEEDLISLVQTSRAQVPRLYPASNASLVHAAVEVDPPDLKYIPLITSTPVSFSPFD